MDDTRWEVQIANVKKITQTSKQHSSFDFILKGVSFLPFRIITSKTALVHSNLIVNGHEAKQNNGSI